jgi:putative Holliday junction resolvase
MLGARLAVDVGAARIGVARCDSAQLLAMPMATIAAGDEAVQQVADLARQASADAVYVGLPLSLSGAVTASTDAACKFAADLAVAVDPIPVRLLDERLTTRSAAAALRDTGHTARSSKHVIDQAAAIVILEHALAFEQRTGVLAGSGVGQSR